MMMVIKILSVKRVLLPVTSLVIMAASVATVHAEAVRVPLPSLHRVYHCQDETLHTTTFTLPVRPTVITGAYIELSGELVAGTQDCGFFTTMDVRFNSRMVDPTTGGTWFASDRTLFHEPFLIRGAYITYDGATWGFLDDGEGFVSLRGICNDEGCTAIFPASARVDVATLVVEGEFEVPVEDGTWGAIKALYR